MRGLTAAYDEMILIGEKSLKRFFASMILMFGPSAVLLMAQAVCSSGSL